MDRNTSERDPEDNISTIPPPEGTDPQPTTKPSQAEGDRETIEEDLRDQETNTSKS